VSEEEVMKVFQEYDKEVRKGENSSGL